MTTSEEASEPERESTIHHCIGFPHGGMMPDGAPRAALPKPGKRTLTSLPQTNGFRLRVRLPPGSTAYPLSQCIDRCTRMYILQV